jgi:polyisoprenoid-binding protein YceI
MQSGNRFAGLAALAVTIASANAPVSHAADNYAIDPAHTSVYFKIPHMGLSWTYGRFNDVAGKFTIDADAPAKSNFALAIKADSIDTGNGKRDEHLRSPDFLSAKQFPAINFTSTQVKPVEGGYEVQGDFTMHGVTKPIKFVLSGGKKAEFPPTVHRTGFSTELMLHRSEFGMDKMVEAVGDDIKVAISFEGVKK